MFNFNKHKHAAWREIHRKYRDKSGDSLGAFLAVSPDESLVKLKNPREFAACQ
jgi:hypothetical protein